MEGLLGRKTPYEKAVLAWKKLDYEKECRRWTKGFYNEKEVLLCKEFLLGEGHSILRSFQKNVLLGKEPSIMRRKFLQDREFC